MAKYRSLDDDGWLVPRPGTKSRAIYELAKFERMRPRQIAQQLGTSSNVVRVLLFNLRHPRRRPDFAEKRKAEQEAKAVPPKLPYAGKSIVFTI
jgi:hypothetical protein